MKNFNTPIQRLGFVILVIGAAMFLLGWTLWVFNGIVYAWEAFVRSVSFDDYNWYGYNYFIALGFYFLIIGLALSYFYNIGIGRLVKWIKMQ
ncbi:TPA: hypothetical protein ACQ8Y2_003027 [Klebsiella pneumoniae]|uniref:hypothetical protein n=1 Tax=Klebsiella pneumoniae TaxID=573 RepID=UPI000E3530DF|nr:hypothetical protein [Klebsiella pneumoniae]HBV6586188.1 hypothetical protein [Klebsiella pneumoniae]